MSKENANLLSLPYRWVSDEYVLNRNFLGIAIYCAKSSENLGKGGGAFTKYRRHVKIVIIFNMGVNNSYNLILTWHSF